VSEPSEAGTASNDQSSAESSRRMRSSCSTSAELLDAPADNDVADSEWEECGAGDDALLEERRV
jgi:hypothetical protein